MDTVIVRINYLRPGSIKFSSEKRQSITGEIKEMFKKHRIQINLDAPKS